MYIVNKSFSVGSSHYSVFSIGTHLMLGFEISHSPRTPLMIEVGLIFINFTFSINKYL